MNNKINKSEIIRQIIHIFFGLIIVLLLYFDFIKQSSLIVILTIAVIFFMFFYLLFYLSKKYRNEYNSILLYKILKILQRFERKADIKKFPCKGALFYLLGTLSALILFKKDIAMASIIVLALGDSFSRLIGPFGRIKHPFNNIKFIEGLIVGWIIAFLGAMLVVKPLEAITASAVAMLVEGLDLKLFKLQINDNLTIPIIAGFVIWLMRTLV